jgi:hypothetical protein
MLVIMNLSCTWEPAPRTVANEDVGVAARLDIDRFARRLRDGASSPYGSGQCVRFVGSALEGAGARASQWPQHARDFGPALRRLGFRLVADDTLRHYVMAKGDVAVIEGTSKCPGGHVQGCDGSAWISDFVQAGFWPGPSYRNEEPRFAIYRP